MLLPAISILGQIQMSFKTVNWTKSEFCKMHFSNKWRKRGRKKKMKTCVESKKRKLKKED
jgi:hypothetical protein